MAHELSREYCRPRTNQRFIVNGQQFKLEGKLGDGAVGVVRKARRINSDHKYAVKFLAPDPKYIDETAFDDVRARFRREGQRGVNIEHPALLKIHAYVENENGEAFQSGTPKNPFLLMDRSTGGTVEAYIYRLPPENQNQFKIDETRLRIAIQIAEALQHLHQQELIHRDVKPANVFLSERRLTNPSVIAKLGDFGVMKWGDFHASLSTGTLTATMQEGLGTLKYMSPEQAIHPKEVTLQADIFSFGLTLFELFTGQVLPSPHHVYELEPIRKLT